jgi:hypothetical protein
MWIYIIIIFVILAIIVSLLLNRCLNEKTTLGGQETNINELSRYFYLFEMPKESYEIALKHSELKYISKRINDGETFHEIGITKEQYDLIVNYNKSFQTTPSISVDGYMFLVYDNYFKNLKPELKLLSVGPQAYTSYKRLKLPCLIHDSMRFVPHNRKNSSGKEYTNKITMPHPFVDHIYGSWYNGPDDEIPNREQKIEIIDKLDEIHEKYDIINFWYIDVTNDFYERGPIVTNEEFEYIYIGVIKSLSHLVVGGKFVMVINLVFNLPIVESLFNILAEKFKNYELIRAKNIIIIQFDNFNGSSTDKFNIEYKEVDYVFYGFKQSLNVPYSSSIKGAKSNLINEVDMCLLAYYTELNAKAYSEPSIDDMIYDNIYLTIDLYKKRNIPYDNYYIAAVTNYYKQVYVELLTINSTIRSAIVSYGEKIPKINDKLKTYYYTDKLGAKLAACGIYTYEEFNSNEQKMREITQDFTRGVSKYLTEHYTINISKISNAFVKLWEIYHTFNLIDSDINAFHMCEAPGQWIKTTEYFNSKRGNYAYSWTANTLNPWNKENIKKFGRDIISDSYGLLKQYRQKWLYGADNTGDITKSANIRWYRRNVKGINLVTGDAGLPYKDLPLIYLQKLDYSQALITLATAANGAHCVIKCFTPYLKTNEESLKSTGFFVNLLYLYYMYFDKLYLYKPYSSNPQSGEFYIVGKNFLGISDINLEKLLTVQDNFTEHQVFVEQKDIPETLFMQIYNFLEKLVELNINTLNRRFFFHRLGHDKDNILNFDLKEINNVRDARFKIWVDIFNFK